VNERVETVADSRVLDRDRIHLTYRYTITEKGRAVLATDPIDRAASEFVRVGSVKTLEVNGRQLTIREAAAELGLKPKTLRARIDRGMSLEDALRPPRSTKRVSVGANDAALAEVAAQAGVSYDTVRRRLAEGKIPERVTAPRYYRETCSREAIRALLASSTTPMTRKEIASALGFHEDAVRQHLDRMRRDGGIACERSDAGPRPLLYSPAAVDMHPADKT
jgi:DNA-directed RNA polymerase specialized sigma24 family protein